MKNFLTILAFSFLFCGTARAANATSDTHTGEGQSGDRPEVANRTGVSALQSELVYQSVSEIGTCEHPNLEPGDKTLTYNLKTPLYSQIRKYIEDSEKAIKAGSTPQEPLGAEALQEMFAVRYGFSSFEELGNAPNADGLSEAVKKLSAFYANAFALAKERLGDGNYSQTIIADKILKAGTSKSTDPRVIDKAFLSLYDLLDPIDAFSAASVSDIDDAEETLLGWIKTCKSGTLGDQDKVGDVAAEKVADREIAKADKAIADASAGAEALKPEEAKAHVDALQAAKNALPESSPKQKELEAKIAALNKASGQETATAASEPESAATQLAASLLSDSVDDQGNRIGPDGELLAGNPRDEAPVINKDPSEITDKDLERLEEERKLLKAQQVESEAKAKRLSAELKKFTNDNIDGKETALTFEEAKQKQGELIAEREKIESIKELEARADALELSRKVASAREISTNLNSRNGSRLVAEATPEKIAAYKAEAADLTVRQKELKVAEAALAVAQKKVTANPSLQTNIDERNKAQVAVDQARIAHQKAKSASDELARVTDFAKKVDQINKKVAELDANKQVLPKVNVDLNDEQAVYAHIAQRNPALFNQTEEEGNPALIYEPRDAASKEQIKKLTRALSTEVRTSAFIQSILEKKTPFSVFDSSKIKLGSNGQYDLSGLSPVEKQRFYIEFSKWKYKP
ncbi:MAG: hypothetical protein R3A80_00940 [Bdellovibrionota bacterium]